MPSIHQADGGVHAGSTVICLHASGGSGAQWKALASQLRPDFRVLTPDLYGHGIAPAWLGAPADIVAADTARIARLAATCDDPVHLVGHSYGGAIALRVARHRPRGIASVVVYEPVTMRLLFDYNRKHRAATEVAEVASNINRALNGGDYERAAQGFVDYWAGAGQWARLAPERQIAMALRMPVIHAHFVALVGDGARLRDYAGISAPVLYLAGRDTRASTKWIAELMESVLHDVELEVLEGMGHLGPVTHAEPVAQRIADFVRQQAAPTADDRKAA
jgi:pimeloyl-ACP methyl ester carboxylesterase